MRSKIRILFVLILSAITVISWNGCTSTDGGCNPEGDGVAPTNVTATAGNGSVTVSWVIPTYDTTRIQSISTQVQYPEAGGFGENCTTFHPNDTPDGCVMGCQISSNSGQCTISGLVNGVAYAFTVVTLETLKNPNACAAKAYARSALVTPSAP